MSQEGRWRGESAERQTCLSVPSGLWCGHWLYLTWSCSAEKDSVRQRQKTQRGRHQSTSAFRGCVNVSHAMMGRLVQGNIALITFISFREFRPFSTLLLLAIFWDAKEKSEIQIQQQQQKKGRLQLFIRGNKVMCGCVWLQFISGKLTEARWGRNYTPQQIVPRAANSTC